MMIILLAVMTQVFTVPADSRGTFGWSLLTINDGIFQAIGVISFAFVCHHNSLLIYGSLKTPTLDRFSLVTHISTSVSLLACLAMALSGFVAFGSKTQGNVLNNFPTSNVLINIARFCFGLNMLTTLPLEAFVCREVMFNYYPGEAKRASTPLHIGISTALVACSMLISLSVCDLGAVFELIGATSACALAYILPPLCYIKLSTRSWKRQWQAIGCVVFGFIVMVISVIQAVTKLVRNDGEPVQCH
jgi:sodium-coupled neutral amino acid transporter 11